MLTRRQLLRTAAAVPLLSIARAEEILPGLRILPRAVNTAVFERNGKTLLIDSGDLQKSPAEWALFTHHPDQASGAASLAANGTRIAVPAAERHFVSSDCPPSGNKRGNRIERELIRWRMVPAHPRIPAPLPRIQIERAECIVSRFENHPLEMFNAVLRTGVRQISRLNFAETSENQAEKNSIVITHYLPLNAMSVTVIRQDRRWAMERDPRRRVDRATP